MKHTHRILRAALAAVAVASVAAFAQIPLLKVTTQNNEEPKVTTICTGQSYGDYCMGSTSTNMKYVRVTSIELTGAGAANFSNNGKPDSIRIRGNSTADAPKKPYRIKFGEKREMFGRTAAKSWVLLANFYDGTFALNAIAFRLGQKMGLEFTPHSQLIEVQINNQNKGIYELTEQIQVNPGRVDIRDKKDWLVEFDYHPADADEIKFNTNRYNLPTFIKSPEVESQFNVSNPTIKFVVDEVNALTNKMAENGFPTNGYRDMIDLESFAKYVLIQQLMDNFDFNSKVQDGALPGSNFAYRDSTGKIKAGPLWDFDLAAGVTSPGQIGGWPGMGGGTGSFPAHYKTVSEEIRPKHEFYRRLWQDEVFLAKFKKAWDKHQSDFSAIPSMVDSIYNLLNSKVQNNANIWANNQMMGNGATLTQQQFKSEIDSLKAWWTKRLANFTQQINAMNIDVSKDIVNEVATVSITFDAMGGSSVPMQTVKIGDKITKPADPTRSGYTFGGWYRDGGNSTGTFVDLWDFNTAVTGKVTLYAKWNNPGGEPPPPPPPSTVFTVSFNTLSNSAQPVPQAQTVDQGAKATKPADMARQPEGQWRFDGWYTDNSTFTTQWNFDVDVVTADVYLYAKWTNAQTGVVFRQRAQIVPGLTAIKNGIIVSTANGASVTVFKLNGSVVRKQAFARGNHTVKLGNLPRGMYLVKSNVDGAKRVVKVAVR